MAYIIPFVNQKHLHFMALVSKEISERRGKTIVHHYVSIRLKDLSSDRISLPLPISIVTDAWLGKKTSTIYQNTAKFATFLNYVYFEAKHPIDNIFDVTPPMVLDFFRSISKSSGYSYVFAMERTITKALYTLTTRNMLTHFNQNNFILSSNNSRPIIYLLDIHNKYAMPRKRPKNILHDIKPEIAFLLLDLAQFYTPAIALGIYFQIFGGLRSSEVVSLEYSDIHYHIGANIPVMTLTIADKDLRPDLSSAFIYQAKKNRKQQIFIIPELFDQIYEMNRRRTANSNSNAVFIDRYGRPITVKSYSKQFQRLKKILIDKLLETGDVDSMLYANVLRSKNWGTHIGRGVFSNIVANNSNTAYDIAVLRGDSSFDSALPYTENTESVRKKISDALESMYRGHKYEETNKS